MLSNYVAVPVNMRKTDWKYLERTSGLSEHCRKLNLHDHPSHLFIISNCWLCRFVLEVWGKDGNECPPKTLHQLCCEIFVFMPAVQVHQYIADPRSASGASFGTFTFKFLPILSRPFFSSRTPNRYQKIEQLFCFLFVHVL